MHKTNLSALVKCLFSRSVRFPVPPPRISSTEDNEKGSVDGVVLAPKGRCQASAEDAVRDKVANAAEAKQSLMVMVLSKTILLFL